MELSYFKDFKKPEYKNVKKRIKIRKSSIFNDHEVEKPLRFSLKGTNFDSQDDLDNISVIEQNETPKECNESFDSFKLSDDDLNCSRDS